MKSIRAPIRDTGTPLTRAVTCVENSSLQASLAYFPLQQSHRSCENYSLLVHDAEQSGRNAPIFWKNILYSP